MRLSFRQAGLFALAAVLAACAQTRSRSPDPRALLYQRALEEIGAFYIAPVSNEKLVVDGSARLVALDRKLSVIESPAPGTGVDIVLRYDGRELAAWPISGQSGARAWGRLAERIVARATAISPVLAALPRGPIDEAVLDGMTGSLDRFSHYSNPTAAADEHAARDGFGGIGVTLAFPKNGFEIAGVEPQGPAGRAGLKPGDRIVAIDGSPITRASPSAVIHRLRGRVRSRVALTVAQPPRGRRRTVEIRRALITPPSVSESEAQGIAVLRVSSFNRNTAKAIAGDLRDSERRPLRGIVLDLRGNPGGLLNQAVAVAELFIAHGPIVATIGRNPASRQLFAASGTAVAPGLPMVVLVNGGSASSSEIVASSLQDHRRAVVIGSASYGKGTVQTVLRLPNHGTLTLTWALLVTPDGYLLNHHGVVPTLCTSGLGNGGGVLSAALARARTGLFSRARATLDGQGWVQLRRACPPQHGRHQIDLDLAERLLADPALYHEALHAIGAGSGLAAGLTRSGAALSSMQDLH